MKTRIVYQKGRIKNDNDFNPLCCVAFNPEDRDKSGFEASLEDKAIFVTAYDEKYATYQEEGKLVRTDYKASSKRENFFQKVIGFLSFKKQEISWPSFPENVNFPTTDDWEDDTRTVLYKLNLSKNYLGL